MNTRKGNVMTENEKLDLLLSEIRDMKCDMQDMKADMQDMKAEMQDMKADIQTLKQKVTDIDLMLENEIRVNIRRVAEGHLDLSRNLHEALKVDNEKEMLSIRVTTLESEMRRIKELLEERLSITA